MTDFATEALLLAEQGFRVFPIAAGSKVPTAKSNGCSDATCDPERISMWWDDHPHCNIGASTDGLIVVDVDPISVETEDVEQLEAAEQQAEWLRLNQERLFNAASAVSQSPRGGKHYWFKAPPESNYRNSASLIAPGIDTRSNGGYVVVAPSMVRNRGDGLPGVYSWIFESDSHVSQWPVAPDWLLDQLVKREHGENVAQRGEQVDWECEPIPQRHRNQALASIGGHLRHRGLTQEEIQSVLLLRNRLCCQPPLTDSEVAHIARSIAKYPPDQVTTAMAFGWNNWWCIGDSAPVDDDDEPPKLALDPGIFPKHLLNPGGFLGKVIDWNLATAIKPQPELALAGALSLMAALTGRNITDSIGSRTNLYALGVCESGGGKEHARKVNKAILQSAGLEKLIGPEGIASHAGLTNVMGERLTVLFQIDEIGRLLQTLQNPNKSPHLYSIVTVLLKLFSSSNSKYVGDAYADLKKIPEIDQPHCVVYGTTVKESLLHSLTKESLSDGFVARLLVFIASENDPESRRVMMPGVPEDLATEAAWWGTYRPGGNLCDVNPHPRLVADSKQAIHVFATLEAASRRKKKESEAAAALWSRCLEKSRKLAMLHAVSLDRNAIEVSGESAQWGADVAMHLTETMEFLASRWVGESSFEGQQLRILRLIEAAGDAGLSKRQVTRQTRGWRTKDREEVLAAMEQYGMIIRATKPTKGRPAMVYTVAKKPD